MSTKIAIVIFAVMVLLLIPLAVQSMLNGDTKTFALSLISIILAFVAVTWIARNNKRNRDKKKK